MALSKRNLFIGLISMLDLGFGKGYRLKCPQ
jgi:hypothetical protein